jgi:hypothetical protein
MKVKELIAELSQLDPELPAYLHCLKCEMSDEIEIVDIETPGCVCDIHYDFYNLPSVCVVDNKYKRADAGTFLECMECDYCLPYRVELI